MKFTLAFAVLVLCLAAPCAHAERLRIFVGPNILVSNDIDAPHVESVLAVNPRNDKNLLAGVTTFSNTNGAVSNKGWVSTDGGQTWMESRLTGEASVGSGDPIVAFGSTGTAYFVALTNASEMDFFRSTDGGRTWRQPAELGVFDHEQVAVDVTHGAHRGRVYITAEGAGLILQRSDDDGRTFPFHKLIVSGNLPKGNRFAGGGVGPTGLVVLADGSLIAGIARYKFGPDKDYHRFSVRASRDGGSTFGPEHVIADIDLATAPHHCSPQGAEALNGDLTRAGSWPMLAADASSGRYANRTYAIWGDCRAGPTRLFFSYSSDHGDHWSEPKYVNAGLREHDGDYQSAIAVNDRGVVGIFFYHTSASQRAQFDVYFTASFDGGQTFTAPQRVSSASSRPYGSGNLRVAPLAGTSSKKGATIGLVSAASRWISGGDYIGIAPDELGNFHALWTDARSGTYQLYTANIALGDTSSGVVGGVKQTINDKLVFVFDPSRYDATTHTLVIPARLKNVSSRVIFAPIVLSLQAKGLNDRAQVLDYTRALGALGKLAPGEVSDAVEWHIKLARPTNLKNLQIESHITGYLRPE